VFYILGIGIFCACTGVQIGDSTQTGETGDTGENPTDVGGLVIFHRYSSYEAWDSVLLMVDACSMASMSAKTSLRIRE